MDNLEKVSLGIWPTPLQRMENLEKRIGRTGLYIKRDDLTDVGLSGNKVRKLEYLLKDAINKGCDTMLTYGGPQTNHGRLTVAAAVRYGMKSILVLNGEKPDYCSGNLVLDKMMGADIRFAGTDPQATAKAVIQEYENAGHKVYEVPVGGSNEIGTMGYFFMVQEIMDQIKEMGISPKYLVTGCGSQGTFCGLWLGAKYFHAPFEIVPVAVNPKTPFHEDHAAELINEISKKYELGITCDASKLKLNFGRGDVSYCGVGYNVPDEETRKAMYLLAQTEAIFTDPCYSGKVFHGYLDMVQHVFEKDAEAIFVHTGGVPAIWSKEHLDAMQAELWN